MAWQIIKQPDGKFCIWSSHVDSVIVYDATEEEIVAEFVEAERKRVTDSVQEILAQLNRGENPYYQFQVSWCKAAASIRRNERDASQP